MSHATSGESQRGIDMSKLDPRSFEAMVDRLFDQEKTIEGDKMGDVQISDRNIGRGEAYNERIHDSIAEINFTLVSYARDLTTSLSLETNELLEIQLQKAIGNYKRENQGRWHMQLLARLNDPHDDGTRYADFVNTCSTNGKSLIDSIVKKHHKNIATFH